MDLLITSTRERNKVGQSQGMGTDVISQEERGALNVAQLGMEFPFPANQISSIEIV
jgi:hypothetical protein